MKIIDLLNKIAIEEKKEIPNFKNLPKTIKYNEIEYSLLWEENYKGKFYICYSEENLSEDAYGELMFDTYNLNDEIEIIKDGERL